MNIESAIKIFFSMITEIKSNSFLSIFRHNNARKSLKINPRSPGDSRKTLAPAAQIDFQSVYSES